MRVIDQPQYLRDSHIDEKALKLLSDYYEQHLRLGQRFGELHIHPAAPYRDENPALMKIHTDKDSFRNNGEGWHSDVSADEEPPMASILHIHQTPSHGGDTLWGNMYEAGDGSNAGNV